MILKARYLAAQIIKVNQMLMGGGNEYLQNIFYICCVKSI